MTRAGRQDTSASHEQGKAHAAPDAELRSMIPAGDLTLPRTPEERRAFSDILDILGEHAHIDFSHYPEPAVVRRVFRRMAFSGRHGYETYRDFLRASPDEQDKLRDDLLRPHVRFFGAPVVLAALGSSILPRILDAHGAKTPIRIWVPGCSTGEDVYSLAISLHESLEDAHAHVQFQLFGTDAVPQHVEFARAALYSDAIRKHVSEERLGRFFDAIKEGYRVVRHLRDACIFSAQDLTQDAPATKVDLIYCRDEFVQLDAALQVAAMPIFYAALDSRGLLLLDPCEITPPFGELFVAVEPNLGLYAKRDPHADHAHDAVEEHRPPANGFWSTDPELAAPPMDPLKGRGRLPTPERDLELRDQAMSQLEGALEQKRMELAQAEEENKRTLAILSESQAAAKLGAWWFDAGEAVLHLTSETYRVFGYSPEVGSPTIEMVLERIHPDDRHRVQETLRTRLEGSADTIRGECRVVLPSGELRFVEHTSRRLHSDDGTVTQLVGTVQDITERKRSEHALEESHEKLRIAIEASGGEYFEMASDGSSFVSSGKRDGLWGLSGIKRAPERDPIAEWLSRVHPEDRPVTERAYSDFIAGRSPVFRVEHRYPHDSEEWMWVSIVAGALHRDDAGAVTYLAGLAFDITEQKKATEALLQSEAKFRGYLDSAPDGLIVWDNEGCVVDTSEATCRLGGYSRSELIGSPFTKLIHPDGVNEATQAFANLVQHGHASLVTRAMRKDQTARVWSIDGVRLSENRLLGVIKDTTETTLRAEQLRHAEKLQAIGQLAGGIAHDFNNQLAGILGYTELIQLEGRNNATIVQYTDNVRQGIKRAAELTAKLLAFSRKGKQLTVSIDLHSVVAEVIGLLRHTFDRRITIHEELRAAPSTVSGDPAQIQNAILNLALNARDAMPEGGILIFRTRVLHIADRVPGGPGEVLAPGTYLALSVVDSGVGMDARIRGRLFEPFFTTKELGQGTGMGLAAVYGIVKSHGGAISVRSKPGQGSTFELYFPSTVSQKTERCDTNVQAKPDECGAHILLVEDEAQLRDATTRMLQRMGYTVTACENGVEAVELYRDQWQAIDLVLLDVMMPEMDGEETFAALHALNPDIVALVSSGYSIDSKAQRIIDLGAKGFLQKPYRMNELSRMVAEALDASEGALRLS